MVMRIVSQAEALWESKSQIARQACQDTNVIVPEVGQYRKSDKFLSLPNKELSTTCYDNAITLAL
jgi:hypothetical protein